MLAVFLVKCLLSVGLSISLTLRMVVATPGHRHRLSIVPPWVPCAVDGLHDCRRYRAQIFELLGLRGSPNFFGFEIIQVAPCATKPKAGGRRCVGERRRGMQRANVRLAYSEAKCKPALAGTTGCVRLLLCDQHSCLSEI
jgi:hypothetical protein